MFPGVSEWPLGFEERRCFRAIPWCNKFSRFQKKSNHCDQWSQSTNVTDRRTDRRTDDMRPPRPRFALLHRADSRDKNSWARTRGAQLSAGYTYTVNTYSKPPLYDVIKGNDVWFSQRAGFLLLLLTQQQQKTSALGKPDVWLMTSIYL